MKFEFEIGDTVKVITNGGARFKDPFLYLIDFPEDREIMACCYNNCYVGTVNSSHNNFFQLSKILLIEKESRYNDEFTLSINK